MGFKMKGSEFYGHLKLNRNMDNTSKPDGRPNSSAMQKRTRTVEKRDDWEAYDPDYSDNITPQKDTLVVKNKKGETVREKDISARRADRIRKRQARKAVKKQARQDVRNSGKKETDQQQQDRISRDFPADFGKEGYTGPSRAELEARWKITDKASPGGGKKKNQPTQAEINALKAEIEAEVRGNK
tara:strand:+ start:197 stop:751 length:555 start_codon:yes stop_codon:yes gene_type:complete